MVEEAPEIPGLALVEFSQVAFFESAAFRRILRSDSPPFSSIFIHFPGLPETKVDIEKKAPFLGLAVLGLSRRVRRGWTLLWSVQVQPEHWMGFDGDDTYAPRRPKLSVSSERGGRSVGKFLALASDSGIALCDLCAQSVDGTHTKFVRWPDGYDVQVADWWIQVYLTVSLGCHTWYTQPTLYHQKSVTCSESAPLPRCHQMNLFRDNNAITSKFGGSRDLFQHSQHSVPQYLHSCVWFNWFNGLQFECQIGDGHVAEYCVELGRKKHHHFGASVSTLKFLKQWRTKLQIQIHTTPSRAMAG